MDPDTPQLAEVSCGLASRRVLQPGLPTSQVWLCEGGGLGQGLSEAGSQGSSLGPENATCPLFTRHRRVGFAAEWQEHLGLSFLPLSPISKGDSDSHMFPVLG